MQVRMNVAAPLRVGGREQQVNKLEFVRHGGKVHAVSPRKLGSLLLSRSERTLDDWNAEVLTKGQGADLTSFLRGQNLLDARSIGEVSRYSAPDAAGVKNEFLPHARDARGRLFIPGTAIKGAIRAAVMWALVDEDRANGYLARKEKESRQRNRRLSKSGLARDLDREVLQSYRLPHRGDTAAHKDLMRALKVADAYGELESRVEKILIQSYTEERGNRTASLGASDTIYVECLTPGSWADFDLKVDCKILRDFEQGAELPFTDEESLLRLVQGFYTAVWEFEQRYYGVGAEQDGEETVPQSAGPPPFEEWLQSEKGIDPDSLSRRGKQRSMLGAEYRRRYDLFDTPDPMSGEPQRRREPQPAGKNEAVRDGREMRLAEVRKFYSGAAPGFRLGWGSGLMSTTVDMRLNEENVGKVLNLISRKHHPHATPKEGPKSRKLVGEGRDPRWPMGWASLEVMG